MTTNRDKILLHPSQVGDIKNQILAEMNKKLNKWDDNLRGIFLSYNKVQILDGAKGRIMDDFASVHYQVRYNAIYLQPTVGDIIRKLSIL